MNKKTRNVVVSLAILTVSVLLLGTFVPITALGEPELQEPVSTPLPEPTATAISTATATPTTAEEIVQGLDGPQKSLDAIVKFISTVLVLSLALFLLAKLWHSSLIWGVVIDEFENTTTETDNLAKTVRACLAEGVRKNLSGKRNTATIYEKNNQVSQLASKIEALDENWLKVLVLILSWLFPPQGISVGGHLLKVGSLPQSHGLIVELSDREAKEIYKTRTFWGPTTSLATQGNIPLSGGRTQVSSSPPPPSAQGSDPSTQKYSELGTQFTILNQFDKAISYLEEGLKRTPNDNGLEAQLADVFAMQAKEKTARTYYDIATKFRVLRLPKALEYYNKAFTFDPQQKRILSKAWAGTSTSSQKAAAFRVLGAECDGHYLRLEAESFYRDAVNDNPQKTYRDTLANHLMETANAYRAIGLLFENLGQYNDAETYLTNALEKSPDTEDIASALVRVKGKKGSVEKSAEADYRLGIIYETKGFCGAAKTHFEEAIKKDPTYMDATVALERVIGREEKSSAQIYCDLSSGDAALWVAIYILADSLSRAKRWPKLLPYHKAQYLNYLGVMYSEATAYEDAIAKFEEAIKQDKEWFLPYSNLGNVYTYIDKLPDSVEKYDTALCHLEREIRKELEGLEKPVIGEVRDLNGMVNQSLEMMKGSPPNGANEIWKKLRDYIEFVQTITIARACSNWQLEGKDEAEKAVSGVSDQKPEDPNVKYTLACFYSLTGQVDTALDWLEKAVQDRKFREQLGDWVWKDPDLKNIRGTERFRRLFLE